MMLYNTIHTFSYGIIRFNLTQRTVSHARSYDVTLCVASCHTVLYQPQSVILISLLLLLLLLLLLIIIIMIIMMILIIAVLLLMNIFS